MPLFWGQVGDFKETDMYNNERTEPAPHKTILEGVSEKVSSYKVQLKQFFAQSFKGWYITIARPKQFLLDCGIPDLPIIITPSTLKRKIKKHELTKEDIEHLNTNINAPLLVYDTAKEHLKGIAYNVIIEKNKEEDSLLCCTIYVNQNVGIEVNNIASIHPRIIEQLTNWNYNGLLIKSRSIEKIKKVVIGSRFNCTKCNNFFYSLERAIANIGNKYNTPNLNDKNFLHGWEAESSCKCIQI